MIRYLVYVANHGGPLYMCNWFDDQGPYWRRIKSHATRMDKRQADLWCCWRIVWDTPGDDRGCFAEEEP